MPTIDDFDLASAIRAAGIAQGADALAMATDIAFWLRDPTPAMVCEAAMDRASTLARLDEHLEGSEGTSKQR